MKRKTILTLAAAATTAMLGVLATPVTAQGAGPQGDRAGALQDGRGAGKTTRRDGAGPAGMRGMALRRAFDADEDGTVTAAEVEDGIAALHSGHDADGSGGLSPDEFTALVGEVARSSAGRRFDRLDADADGEISAEEMALPARRMARMQRMRGRDAERQ